MSTIVYTLKLRKDTEELHLFRATPNPNNTCTPVGKSICKKMDLSESIKNEFACEDEATARKECANLGRKVCGTCVSSLYQTY